MDEELEVCLEMIEGKIRAVEILLLSHIVATSQEIDGLDQDTINIAEVQAQISASSIFNDVTETSANIRRLLDMLRELQGR